jgi:hypothetical protein
MTPEERRLASAVIYNGLERDMVLFRTVPPDRCTRAAIYAAGSPGSITDT